MLEKKQTIKIKSLFRNLMHFFLFLFTLIIFNKFKKGDTYLNVKTFIAINVESENKTFPQTSKHKLLNVKNIRCKSKHFLRTLLYENYNCLS